MFATSLLIGKFEQIHFFVQCYCSLSALSHNSFLIDADAIQYGRFTSITFHVSVMEKLTPAGGGGKENRHV